MGDTTASCSICQIVLAIRLMRYNKCKLNGLWEYQCPECRRRIKSGELNH
jgi:uncharacterized protein YlaI